MKTNKVKFCKYCKEPIIFKEHNWRYNIDTKEFYHTDCFLKDKKNE